MKTAPTTLALGSYSHGTLRLEDLIPTFLGITNEIRLTREERTEVSNIRRRYLSRSTFENLAEQYFGGGEAPADLEALTDLLNDYVPDYCYFGTHEGDGSDFGVWVVTDLLDDGQQGSYDGSVFRSNDSPDDNPKARNYDFWLTINDHGNATLYRRTRTNVNHWKEVWAIV